MGGGRAAAARLLASLAALVVAAPPVGAGKSSLRGDEPWALREGGSGEEAQQALQARPSRSLQSLQTCAAATVPGSFPWIITCGGSTTSSATCAAPVCPSGYNQDKTKPSCTIGSWVAPQCKPWTVRVTPYGLATASVDWPYTVLVQAFSDTSQTQISFAEGRTVRISVTGQSGGAADNWDVVLVNGQVRKNITRTVAGVTRIQLAQPPGNQWGTEVVMGGYQMTFIPGATAQYVFPLASASGTVDAPVFVEIQALDQYGNLNTFESRGLSVTWLQAPGQVVSSGVPVLTAGSGFAQIYNQVPGVYTVSLTGPSFPATVSDTISVYFTFGAPRRYAFIVPNPAGTTFTVGTLATVTLEVQDQFGNRVTSENRGVTIVATRGGGFDTTTVNVASGFGSARISGTVAEVVRLSLVDSSFTGLDVSSTFQITYVAGPATRVVVQAATGVAGTVDAPLQVNLQALDAYGNLAVGESRAVDVRLSGSQVSGAGKVQLAGGQGSVLVGSLRPQSVQVTLSDTYGTGLALSSTVSLSFAAGAPRSVAFTGVSPATGMVGSAVAVSLTAYDQYGNQATRSAFTLMLRTTGTAANIDNKGQVDMTGGQATVQVQSVRAETMVLSMDSAPPSVSTSATRSITFGPGLPVRVGFVGSSATVSVDVAAQVNVQALDAFGNVATSASATIGVRELVNGTVVSVSLSGGQGSATLTRTVAETVRLAPVDTGGTGWDVSNTFFDLTFVGGAARRIALSAWAYSTTVDHPAQVTLTALDQFGNPASSESRAVQVLTNGTLVSGAGRQDLRSGQALAAISSQRPQVVQVTLADAFATGLDVSATLALTFSVGAAVKVAIAAADSGTVGQPLDIFLTRTDQYGNLVQTGSAGVAVRCSGSATLSDNGVAQLGRNGTTLQVTDFKAETVTLSLEDTFGSGLDVSAVEKVLFVPGPARMYAFTAPAASASVDSSAHVAVQALDAFGNLAPSQEADIAVASSMGGPPTVVNIMAGQGFLQVSETVTKAVTLTLVDTAGTGLDVSGAGSSMVVNFLPGATKSVLVHPLSTQGTVDKPIQVAFSAHDRYGNLVTSEGRSFELAAQGIGPVAGTGRVDLLNGTAEAAISSQLAQSVTLSLRDTWATGIDLSATASVSFHHGQLHYLRLTDPTGARTVLKKVNRTATVVLTALDQYSNVVTNASSVTAHAEVTPQPPNSTNPVLTWELSEGVASTEVRLLGAGSFDVRLTDAKLGAGASTPSASQLDSAVSRADVFTIVYRWDLTPPDYETLNTSSVTDTEVVVGIFGLTKDAKVWCIAANATGGPPRTPQGVSDGAVFSALKGLDSANESAPGASGGPFLAGSSTQFTLENLLSSQTYAIRCAAVDEDGNPMSGERILEHQLLVTTLTLVEQHRGPDHYWTVKMFIAGLILTLIAALFLGCAGYVLWRARRAWKRVFRTRCDAQKAWDKVTEAGQQALAKVGDGAWLSTIPASTNGLIVKLQLQRQSLLRMSGQPLDATIQLSESDSDDDQVGGPARDLPSGDDDTNSKLIEEALILRQEIVRELERRGADEAVVAAVEATNEVVAELGGEEASSSDASSEVEDELDTSAVLRDVKAFLRRDNQGGNDMEATTSLRLPALPLLLDKEAEARLAAILALAQHNRPWEARVQYFNQKWAGAEGVWQAARDAAFTEQEYRQVSLQVAKDKLEEVNAALETVPEHHEANFLDALAEEEAAFAAEAKKHLQELQTLSVDWPEKDAALRGALLDEWSAKIEAANDRSERQKLRKEAVAALRKLANEREDALEAELQALESRSGERLKALEEARADAWRAACENVNHSAAQLRAEAAALRLQVARLGWEAEESALQAVLRIRRQLRDATVEAETQREAQEREKELAERRQGIELALAGDSEEATELRQRALAALERAAAAAAKVAADEKERRQQHWHEILDERSRERIKTARRRFVEEERRLADEAAAAEDEAAEVAANRKASLLLGAHHRAEAALLGISGAAQHSRILMGLQATAAEAVAEEKLPKKEGGSGAGSLDPALNTGARWMAAKQRVAAELSEHVGIVAESLSAHSQRQRILLTQRQGREAFLVAAPEGDDEDKEDLLDALEENMRRELRVARWQCQADAADILARKGDGVESGLGRRLAAVARESQLLETEDDIGEKYDALRALVLGDGGSAKALDGTPASPSLGATLTQLKQNKAAAARFLLAVRRAKDLEDQAARLRAAVEADKEREEKGRQTEALLREAAELEAKGDVKQALDVMRNALQQEDGASDSDGEAVPRLNKVHPEEDPAPRGFLDAAGKAAEAAARELEERRRRMEDRLKRRQDARELAKELQAQGRTAEAVQVVADALAAEAAEEEPAAAASAGGAGELAGPDGGWIDERQRALAEEAEAQRRRAQERLAARRRRQAEGAELVGKASEVEGGGKPAEEAVEAILALLDDGEADGLDAGPSVADILAAVRQAADDDLEERRRRMEERLRQRQRARDRAEELGAQGRPQEALEVVAAQLAKEAAESEADLRAAEAAMGGAKFSAPDGGWIDERGRLLSSEAQAQLSKMQQRLLARQRRQEECTKLAGKAAESQGQGEAAVEAALALLDAGQADALAAAAEAADIIAAVRQVADDDLEERRRRMEERLRRRQQAKDRAQELAAEGRQEEALEVLAAQLREEAADAEAEVREAESALGGARFSAPDGGWIDERGRLLSSEEQAQLCRMQERLAARQRQRGGAEDLAKQVAAVRAAGQHEKAFEAALALLDAAEVAERDLEERRRRMEERLRRRQESKQLAKELQAQGRTQEAIEVVAAELREQAAEAEADVRGSSEAPAPDGGWIDERGRLLSSDGQAQRGRLQDRLAARQRRRDEGDEIVQQAGELQAQGKGEEAFEGMLALLDASEVAERDLEERRRRMEERLGRRKDAKALAKELQAKGRTKEAVEAVAAVLEQETAEAEAAEAELAAKAQADSAWIGRRGQLIGEDGEAQRSKALERVAERQRRREEAQRCAGMAQTMEGQGKQEEALEAALALLVEAEAADDAEAKQQAEGSSAPAGLASDLLSAAQQQRDQLAKEAGTQRSKAQARLQERQRRRDEAVARAEQLEAEGRPQEALAVMMAAVLNEPLQDVATPSAAGAADSPTTQAQGPAAPSGAVLTEGLRRREELLQGESEAQRSKAEARRAERQKKREEAQRQAEELERQAAELKEVAPPPLELESAQAAEELDPIAAWQAEARQRSAVGEIAASLQKGQESAAKRLVDEEASAEDRAAIKGALAAEMERCQQSVAQEREAQRLRAQERLRDRQRKREEAKQALEKEKGKAAAKLRTKIRFAVRGVSQLRALHSRRQATLQQQQKEVEQKVRAQAEAELRLLEVKLRAEAEQEMAMLRAEVYRLQQLQTSLEAREKQAESTNEEVRRVREAIAQHGQVAASLLESEQQRQAERMQARLARRRAKLEKEEAAVHERYEQEAVRAELQHEREKLQAKPPSQVKVERLVKDLDKVNNLIAKLQGGTPRGPSKARPPKQQASMDLPGAVADADVEGP